MEPGRKDPISECNVGVALGDEVGSVYSRETDGRGRRDITLCLWISPRARIFNYYAFGTSSSQTKILFWQVTTAETTRQGLETKTHLPCDNRGSQSPGVLATRDCHHPDCHNRSWERLMALSSLLPDYSCLHSRGTKDWQGGLTHTFRFSPTGSSERE